MESFVSRTAAEAADGFCPAPLRADLGGGLVLPARPRDRSAAVDQDCIKLTSYCSDDRSGIGITSARETQTGLYVNGEIAASILPGSKGWAGTRRSM